MPKSVMNFKQETIKINEKTGIKLFSKGSGEPQVLLTAGLHGNEISGITVVLKAFRDIEPTKGTLTLIPAVNKLGIEKGSRNNPQDNKDLNRIFKESSSSPSKKIMERLVSLATKYDAVIDFHNFFGAGYTTAFQFKTGNEALDTGTADLIKAFSPEVVRQKNNGNFRDGFVQELLRREIKSFVVELPQQKVITNKEIENVSTGIRNVLATLGMLNETTLTKKPVIVETNGVKHKTAGVFSPVVKLGQLVRKGEKVGTITNLETLKQEEITAPIEGTVQTNPKIKYVRENEPLMSIGKKIG